MTTHRGRATGAAATGGASSCAPACTILIDRGRRRRRRVEARPRARSATPSRSPRGASWWWRSSPTSRRWRSRGWPGRASSTRCRACSRRTRYRDLLPPLFVGFLFNTVLAARVGEIVKVLLLRRRMERRAASGRPRPRCSARSWRRTSSRRSPGSSWCRHRPLPAAALLRVVRVDRARRRLPGDRRSWRSCPGPGHHQLPPWLNTGPLWARAHRAALAAVGRGAREPPGPARPPPDEPRRRREPRDLARPVGGHLLHALGLRPGARRLGRRRAAAGDRSRWPRRSRCCRATWCVFQAAAVVPLTASYGVPRRRGARLLGGAAGDRGDRRRRGRLPVPRRRGRRLRRSCAARPRRRSAAVRPPGPVDTLAGP